MEEQIIIYTPAKPTGADVEKAKRQLENLVIKLEAIAYDLMALSATPVFYDCYDGGKMKAYAEIIQDISTNICQEFELYG